MAVKNILVAYDGNEPSESALGLAVGIAQEHDAHLTGLLAQPIPLYPVPDAAWLPVEVMDSVAERLRERAAEIERKFHAACAAEGRTDRTSFHAAKGAADGCFIEFSRTYDLVVVGQPKGEFWGPIDEPHPDEIALRSGRPVIVAPRQMRPTPLEGGALLAWDGGRAGARALADAMATVLDGARLTVLHVGEDDSEVRRPGRDVMQHLSRHGLHAELIVMPRGNRPVADLVLEIAESSGAGLLIMGAYEHSAFGEALLGGVTRDVLRQTKIPVLLSH